MKRPSKAALERSARRRVNFGQHIYHLRMKLGIPQDELARRMGLARTSIVNIEAGKQLPPLTSLPEYAKALETTINIICHGIRE